jgi:solute carrier family 25 phosphate transporter 3
VTFLSGYWAGIFCALVSQPADTLVSKLNKDPSKSIGQYINELGVQGLYRGMVARIIMVGTLTGLQWWIYDTFKVAVGLQASGGG